MYSHFEQLLLPDLVNASELISTEQIVHIPVGVLDQH